MASVNGDAVLATIAAELVRYRDHHIAVSGSLRNVLSGEDADFCDAYFDGHRSGRYTEIYALVQALLPKIAYGSTLKYKDWINHE